MTTASFKRSPGGWPANSGNPAQAQCPDHPHGFQDDLFRHFRGPHLPVHEHDGDFLDLQPALPAVIIHLDLERVSIGTNTVQVDVLENGSAIALEAARGVGEGHSCDNTDVQTGALAEKKSAQFSVATDFMTTG